MDEDVGDPVDVGTDGGADGAGNAMGLLDGELGVDFEVEVDVVLEAGFAGEAFLDAEGTGDLEGAVADFSEHGGGGHGVEEFPGGLAKDLEAEDDDEDGDKDAADGIGVGEDGGVVEVEAYGEDSDAAGEDVEPVVSGIGLEGGGAELLCSGMLPAGEGEFNRDGEEDCPDGEGLRRDLRLLEVVDGLPAEEGAGSDEEGPDGLTGEDLETAVAIGVVLVGRFGGDAEAEPEDEACYDVAGALDTVGDDGYGTGDDAGCDFDECQEETDGDADFGDAQRGLSGMSHPCLG